MIVIIDGAAGAGKTWLLARLIKKEWKRGTRIFPNFPLWFDDDKTNIFRWYALDETFGLKRGIIVVDDAVVFMDARRWNTLPYTFTEKIALHRHHLLDIYSTTQDFGHIDIRMRSNVHERYSCATVFRIPRNQRKKPVLQMIKVHKRTRSWDTADQRVKWNKLTPRFHFISKYWTRKYYNTYEDTYTPKFLCRIIYQKVTKYRGQWTGKIYSRDLVNSRRAKL